MLFELIDTETGDVAARFRSREDAEVTGETVMPGTYSVREMPEADDVRAEASRRMQALFGARDAAHLSQIIQNADREATRLISAAQGVRGPGGQWLVPPRAWSEDEATRALQLRALDAWIEQVRAASNAMEPAPPLDFRDDKHWPSPPGADNG